MIYRNLDKQAIKQNAYAVLTKITIVDTNREMTQDDYIMNWNYEDYRYVPNNGFIGEFVERILDGNLSQLPSDVILEDKEINLQIGIVNSIDNKTTWYDYGNFLITKVEEQDTNGNMKFESADYAKKFNIAYVDSITYPCTALQLANNVCSQAGVGLATSGKAYTYIVTDEENGLVAGDYSIQINSTYYKFKTTSNLKKNDSITFITNNNKMIVRSVDLDLNVIRTELTYTTSSSATGSVLSVIECDYCDFINNDFVIEGNQFTDDGISCRDVIKDVAKLAYSWVRVGTDNKVHIDFHKKSISDVDTYNELTTEEYYISKKQDLTFGPVNKVLIGMSQVEGENRFKTSDTYTEETECAIKIYDNKLTYTDELRMIALNGAESLFDLEYTPLIIDSIGHPWLEADDYIKLTNVDSDVLYTYPFDRKMEYKGYITTTLQSIAQTATQTAYENSNTLFDKISRTEIIVDKQNKKITAVVDDVDTITKKTTTSVSATGYPIEIEDAGAYDLQSNVIYGNSEQETSVQGKNKFNGLMVKGGVNNNTGELTNDGDTYRCSKLIPVKANTTYIFSNNGSGVGMNVFEYNNSNFIGRITSGAISAGVSFTTSSNTTHISIFRNSTNIDKLQLEEGRTITSYEPFTPNMPSPDYPSEVKTVKGITNLFDGVIELGGINTSGNYDATNRGRSKNYIEVEPNATYSLLSNGSLLVCNKFFYDNAKKVISSTVNGTFTTPSNCKYIRFYSAYGTDTTDDIKDKELVIYKNIPTPYVYVPYGTWLIQKTTGKNLFDKDDITIGKVWNGVSNVQRAFGYIPFDGGDYTVKINSKGNFSNILLIETTQIGEVISGSDKYTSYLSANTPVTRTFDSSAKYIVIQYQANDTITKEMIDNVDIQIEKGTQSTPYEEYKENTALIDMNNPNLFDKNSIVKEEKKILNDSGVEISDNSGGYTKMYIPVKPNTTYTIIGMETGGTKRIYYFNDSQTFISRSSGFGTNYNTFTTPSNCYYIDIQFYLNTMNFDNYTIYEGTNSTPYYELCKIGEVADDLDVTNGVLTKRIGNVVLNGSESWNGGTKAGDYLYVYSNSYDNILKPNKSYKGLSNAFKVLEETINTYNPVITTDSISLGSDTSTAGNRVRIKIKNINSIADFKTWLSNNPVEVYYILDEPQTIQLDKNNLSLFQGYNHISVDSDVNPINMVVTYLTDSELNSQYVTQNEWSLTKDGFEISIGGLTDDLSNNYATKQEYADGEVSVGYVKVGEKYEFGRDGLKIHKVEDGTTSSTLNEKGLIVEDSSNNQILYAGYDEKYSSSVLKTQRMIINDYIRFENYTTEDNKKAVGCFWVGD